MSESEIHFTVLFVALVFLSYLLLKQAKIVNKLEDKVDNNDEIYKSRFAEGEKFADRTHSITYSLKRKIDELKATKVEEPVVIKKKARPNARNRERMRSKTVSKFNEQ